MVVISLLGVLAVGLMAAVDPFEQLKKGQDTSKRQAITEFQEALIRYYGSNFSFPTGLAAVTSSPLTNYTANVIPTLEASGELKKNFQTGVGGTTVLSRMYLTAVTAVGSESIIICYQPSSKSFQLDDNTVYNAAGVTTAGCQGTGGATACNWCIR